MTESELKLRLAQLEARLSRLERQRDAAPERAGQAGRHTPWRWVRLTTPLSSGGTATGNFVYQTDDGTWVETRSEVAGIWAPYRFTGTIAAGRGIRVGWQPPFADRAQGRLYAIGADCP